jgi:Ca2+-binding RTX toxin-like protein
MAGDDSLRGGEGLDELRGGDGDDSMHGDGGNDRLDGGTGVDRMYGGLGDDTYIVTDVTDYANELAGEGTDSVLASISDTLRANVENLTLLGAAAINGTGNGLANVITGNALANVLNGLGGSDTMRGGAGNDTYVVNTAGDVVVEGSGEGTDHVQSSASYTLTDNVENLTLTSTARVNGTGNDLANVISGNAAANVLNGAAGADRMSGGAGNDSYIVDNVGDRTIESSSTGGTDQVRASISFTLGTDLENLTLTGTAAINGAGNALANTITGNAAANLLSGGGGDDVLRGLVGADRLNGGTGNDILVGGRGVDLFLFNTALNASTNVDRITDFSRADDTIQLDNDVFTAAGAVGTLSAAAFRAGTAAQDADDRIIYDSATGKIYYDADGNGAGSQVLFAKINAGIALTNADFSIVG